MSTYSPGTVAVATVRGVPNVRVMRGDGIFAKWYSNRPVTGSLTSFSDGEVTDVRPLVVLDPTSLQRPKHGGDDAYGAAELARTLHLIANADEMDGKTYRADIVHELADQIETQTRPPKPAEPTGLGAVVEDAEGDKWVYMAQGAEGAHWYRVGVPARNANYFQIDAVRILSAGVSQ